MARLIFESAEILNTSDASQGVISGITVEGVEITKEPSTVDVENGRTINESFTGGITIRTVNDTFNTGAESLAGTSILDSGNAFVSTDGSLPTEGKLKLNGVAGSHDIVTGPVYIMGHEDFTNGRLEIVLSANNADTGQGDVLTVSAAS
jgi:hypothetical protein